MTPTTTVCDSSIAKQTVYFSTVVAAFNGGTSCLPNPQVFECPADENDIGEAYCSNGECSIDCGTDRYLCGIS
jgi:hypothetical protein